MYVTFVLLIALSQALSVRAACNVYPSLVYCQNNLPESHSIQEAGNNVNIIIQNYNGSLTFNGHHDLDDSGVFSIQILRSTISYIQPSYFARISKRKLKKLSMASVEGTVNLDYATLSGLEESLEELRVSDVRIGTTDYLYTLNKLKSLYLVRTKLSVLPDNFPILMGHLTNMDLSNNELSTMPWNILMKSVSGREFGHVRLDGNPWKCDCDMKPVVEAPVEDRRKIINLICAQPEELASLSVTNLSPNDVCPNGGAQDKSIEKVPGGQHQENATGPQSGPLRPIDPNGLYPEDGRVEVATAGSVSNEVIAIIIAVILVIVIVLIAVIVFKVRSRKAHQNQGGSSKKPSHKSSAYCHVIEHPNTKQTPSAKNSTGGPPPSGTQPQNYGKDQESNERQPLAPSYYSQQDNRL